MQNESQMPFWLDILVCCRQFVRKNKGERREQKGAYKRGTEKSLCVMEADPQLRKIKEGREFDAHA